MGVEPRTGALNILVDDCAVIVVPPNDRPAKEKSQKIVYKQNVIHNDNVIVLDLFLPS